jgi:hypothetical protein
MLVGHDHMVSPQKGRWKVSFASMTVQLGIGNTGIIGKVPGEG